MSEKKIKFRVVCYVWDNIYQFMKEYILHECSTYEIAEHFAKTSTEQFDLEIKKVYVSQDAK